MLTKRQIQALRLLRDNFDTEDGEMVYEKGQCYIGLEKFSGRTLFALLKVMAIRMLSTSTVGGFEVYTINETGLKLLERLENV